VQAITVYGSQSEAYHRAFKVFLDHTDQKANARAWLQDLVRSLPSRRVFIDAGAGNGQVTAWFVPSFERTIAIEPNDSLRDELRRACPSAEVIAEPILEAKPSATADLVLCSHVFYYIERAEWMATLDRLASWLAPGGILVVVLQNPGTDCMRMLKHFLAKHFDLSGLAQAIHRERGDAYEVGIDTVPAHVSTPGFDSAYTVAEFMLNLLHLPDPPSRRSLEDYVRAHFRDQAGTFRFSCHQDFLRIRRRS